MAGKFINTTNQRSKIMDSVLTSVKNILNNPYYLMNDKRATKVTYLNLNTTMTTLDESTRGNYSEFTHDSPARYNRINGFYLYGISRIEPNLEISEFGLQTSDVSADAVVLPNTIIPYPGDVFFIDSIEKDFLFQVTAVNPNTLDTGSLMYRINYTLISTDGISRNDIESKIVKSYTFSVENYGSNFGCLITDDDLAAVSEIEKITTMLKDYYMAMFYNSKVQTFTYTKYDGYRNVADRLGGLFGLHVHDQFLLEFIIRNNILGGSSDYIYLQHQIVLPATFAIDYDKTFFSSLENKDIEHHLGRTDTNLWLCTQRLSLLYAYPEDYYYTNYSDLNHSLNIINIFDDPDFCNKIKRNEKTTNILKNIIIMWFNNEPIDSEILKDINHIDYMDNMEMYYLIPMAIFCLEKYIQDILANQSAKGGVNNDTCRQGTLNCCKMENSCGNCVSKRDG